ncbi:uncharacterized protein CDV56_101396 [Aspergillus thermomutatus]|uniref:Major facilitator superfamily (MFS) profile domain-containing protein n=1 Tax=Aspergillus thermomutatus TaxID=41047 RepID=A0A397GXW7_ASPTH|nr:uncharacterized protein CDV56_101396 [Aspergillus thermomutatus]RHZ52900.1 hypothetical protein CDV56_101396 [Aspergillus thermomutatus]
MTDIVGEVKKDMTSHVEDVEVGQTAPKKSHVMDPLNMPTWQKGIILVVISIFSTLGLALVSGFGGLLGFYIPRYAAAGKGYDDITHLMTYPSLFMGIGNLIGMPIAIGVGRRIVLLVSTMILVIGAVLCALEKNYEWHLASRMVVGLAAGQSEALVPMITQEIFFLHERSKALMGQQAIQVSLTAVWVLFAGPLPKRLRLSGETKYDRSAAAYQEDTSSQDAFDDEKQSALHGLWTTRPPLDFESYEARTWKSELRLWVGRPDWHRVWEVLEQTFQLLLFPQVLWALLLNGLTIGVNIAIGTTYATILSGAPYSWPDSSASYINCGQIVTALVALPLLGHGSDYLVKYFARRNGGLHEPEVRIIPLILPIIVGVFTSALYGEGAQHPDQYHWFVYAWAVAAYYFCFVGANIVAITYLLDSYPTRAGPLLVIICAFRGIISFGTSYGTAPFIASHGYDGAFGTFAGLTGALGLLGIPVYFWGKKIRQFTGRFARDESD